MDDATTYSIYTPEVAPPDRDELKPAINNLLWMYGDQKLTLAEAEDRAIQIMTLIIAEPGRDSAE